MRGPVPLLHLLLGSHLQAGDHAADATCGNGKDTMLLARLVGEKGHVYSFDIQPEAIRRTEARLQQAGLTDRVTLFNCCHTLLEDCIRHPLAAIIFNLGWLPGGNRTIITKSCTTIPALQHSLRMLQENGLLLITCYPGHDGGDRESHDLLAWSEQLPSRRYHVWRMGQLNVPASAPFCIVIQRCGVSNGE